jgi:hypothetical protein
MSSELIDLVRAGTVPLTPVDVANDEIEGQAIAAWPKLPAEALYGVLGDLVRLATENSEADPAAVLMTGLVWAGAMIGPSPYVMIGESRVRARIFAVLVGASSRARKGTSAEPVRRVFRAAEEALRRQGVSLQPLAESHGPLSTGEGLTYAVRDASDKTGEDGKPLDEGVTDKRLLVMEEEFGAPLKAAQRDGNTLSAILRMAWDSGNISPMTKSNRIKVTGAHVNFVGHITRMELEALLTSSDIWNGLANRILWACVRRSKLLPFPRPMDDTAVEEIAYRISWALRNAWQTQQVTLSLETITIWQGLYPYLSRDLPGIRGAVTARAEAYTIRLALLLCLLDAESVIQPQHLQAAVAIWNYCDASAAAIFGETTTDPVANTILDALESGAKTQTQLRDLFGRNLSGDQLNSTLSHLQAVGRIDQRKEQRTGRGRPVTIWFLSPSDT